MPRDAAPRSAGCTRGVVGREEGGQAGRGTSGQWMIFCDANTWQAASFYRLCETKDRALCI